MTRILLWTTATSLAILLTAESARAQNVGMRRFVQPARVPVYQPHASQQRMPQAQPRLPVQHSVPKAQHLAKPSASKHVAATTPTKSAAKPKPAASAIQKTSINAHKGPINVVKTPTKVDPTKEKAKAPQTPKSTQKPVQASPPRQSVTVLQPSNPAPIQSAPQPRVTVAAPQKQITPPPAPAQTSITQNPKDVAPLATTRAVDPDLAELLRLTASWRPPQPPATPAFQPLFGGLQSAGGFGSVGDPFGFFKWVRNFRPPNPDPLGISDFLVRYYSE